MANWAPGPNCPPFKSGKLDPGVMSFPLSLRKKQNETGQLAEAKKADLLEYMRTASEVETPCKRRGQETKQIYQTRLLNDLPACPAGPNNGFGCQGCSYKWNLSKL